MKSRLIPSLLAASFLLPALAHAHPGHDGDHELVWEFGHLASHPFATFLCFSLFAAGAWAIWRLVKMNLTARKQPVRRDDRR